MPPAPRAAAPASPPATTAPSSPRNQALHIMGADSRPLCAALTGVRPDSLADSVAASRANR
jgi:hypothetical protein